MEHLSYFQSQYIKFVFLFRLSPRSSRVLTSSLMFIFFNHREETSVKELSNVLHSLVAKQYWINICLHSIKLVQFLQYLCYIQDNNFCIYILSDVVLRLSRNILLYYCQTFHCKINILEQCTPLNKQVHINSIKFFKV